jgi:hypothetical protein
LNLKMSEGAQQFQEEQDHQNAPDTNHQQPMD